MSALSTLYGAAGQSTTALAGNVGGLAREQEAWTPDWIVDVAREAMGGIQLDPCGASSYDSTVIVKATKSRKEHITPVTGGWFADVTLVKPGSHEGLKASPHGGTVISMNGLSTDWTDARGVFVNPPYGDLEPWLAKCAETGDFGEKIICLGPMRTHRSWFPRHLAGVEVVCLGYRVIFKGHTDAFPAPLFLTAWNCTIPDLGVRETGRMRFV